MREVITYVAFDGEEFNSAERCREYEQKYQNSLMGIKEAYTFYNAEGDIIPIAAYDIEALLDDLERAYFDCEKIVVKRNVSRGTLRYLYDATGIVLPDDAGVYKYDFDNGNGWESVSE